jgi:hypothetical protein
MGIDRRPRNLGAYCTLLLERRAGRRQAQASDRWASRSLTGRISTAGQAGGEREGTWWVWRQMGDVPIAFATSCGSGRCWFNGRDLAQLIPGGEHDFFGGRESGDVRAEQLGTGLDSTLNRSEQVDCFLD